MYRPWLRRTSGGVHGSGLARVGLANAKADRTVKTALATCEGILSKVWSGHCRLCVECVLQLKPEGVGEKKDWRC